MNTLFNLKRGRGYFQLIVLLCFCLLFAIEAQATVRYVRPASHGDGSGSSWANASNDLQLMINNSATGDSVFVAAGTYIPKYTAKGYNAATATYPYTDGGRDNSFVLKADVKIFGGFPDNGTATWAHRDWNAYPSILSGDRGVPNDSTDNCYHVVISTGEVGSACLDGITVTKGNALGLPYFYNFIVNGYIIAYDGAGICIVNSSPILTNLIIRRNVAYSGGGISNCENNQLLNLTNVLIDSNEACCGGGISNHWNTAPLILTNVIIKQNKANICRIVNNYAEEWGMGGGIYNYAASVILTNVLIVENISYDGGGIWSGEQSSLTLTNVTISKNVVNLYEHGGGGIHHNGYSLTVIVRNSIIWGNRFTSSYSGYFLEDNIATLGGFDTLSYTYSLIGSSIVDKEPIGEGIIFDKDPLFIDAANGDYRLSCNSPAKDVGYNAYYSADSLPDLSTITTDLFGNRRIYNGIVDLGAYELQRDSILFSPLSFVYSGSEHTPKATSLSGFLPNILYKEKNAPDNTYSPNKPINAGSYTIKAHLPIIGMCEEITDSADFEILPREITIKAINDTIYYGQTPVLAYEIVSGNLVNGDVLSGALYVDNYEAGIHTIEQGTLTAGSNYIITFIEGTLLVWSIQDVFVDGKLSQLHKNYFQFDSECGQEEASVYVTCYQCVKILINGIEQNPCTVALPYYGDNTVLITVIASNSDEETHTLTINRPIPFDQIVKMHCDNTLTVNNNPLHNGGFSFTSFKWFCNDRKINENQSWSVSAGNQWWSPSDLFHVELTANGYSGILRSCKGKISLKDMELKFYPNPVLVWQNLYINGDLDDDCLKNATIEIYDMRGRLTESFPLTSLQIPIDGRYVPGVYLIILTGKDKFRKEAEIIIYE